SRLPRLRLIFAHAANGSQSAAANVPSQAALQGAVIPAARHPRTFMPPLPSEEYSPRDAAAAERFPGGGSPPGSRRRPPAEARAIEVGAAMDGEDLAGRDRRQGRPARPSGQERGVAGAPFDVEPAGHEDQHSGA